MVTPRDLDVVLYNEEQVLVQVEVMKTLKLNRFQPITSETFSKILHLNIQSCTKEIFKKNGINLVNNKN